MTLRIFERCLYGAGGLLFLFWIAGSFLSSAIVERIYTALLVGGFFPAAIGFCVWNILDARKTGSVTVRVGWWKQTTDRSDPMLFMLALGCYWSTAIGFFFFFLADIFGTIRFGK